MDYRISLQRIVLCPHCGTQNRIDLEDYSETTYDKSQMGEEILYQFDVDDYECISCGQRFRISGYISEYPAGRSIPSKLMYCYDYDTITKNGRNLWWNLINTIIRVK